VRAGNWDLVVVRCLWGCAHVHWRDVALRCLRVIAGLLHVLLLVLVLRMLVLRVLSRNGKHYGEHLSDQSFKQQ